MSYKVSAQICWSANINDDPNIKALLKKELEGFLPPDYHVQSVRVEPKPKKCRLKVIAEYPINEIFTKISSSEAKVEFVANNKSYFVKMNSQRYFVFKENNKCVSCGIEGSKFLLEQHPNDSSPHFNLYAIEDGDLVLMTKDHIHAKAFGGEDRHYNYQTMCSICNNLKGSDYIPLEGIAELKKFYSENKFTLPKKKLNTELNHIRAKHSISRPELRLENHNIVSKIDMNIMEDENGKLLAISVYDASDKYKDWKHVASIKKGYPLHGVKMENDKVLVPYDDRYFEIYKGVVNIC